MLTRKLNNAGTALVVGLVTGLLSQTTAATEIVVAYGGEAVAAVQAREAQFQSSMKDYAQSLNQDLKATLDRELKRVTVPALKLALTETETRG